MGSVTDGQAWHCARFRVLVVVQDGLVSEKSRQAPAHMRAGSAREGGHPTGREVGQAAAFRGHSSFFSTSSAFWAPTDGPSGSRERSQSSQAKGELSGSGPSNSCRSALPHST